MRVNKILLTANVNKSQISKTETHYKITGIPITVDDAVMNGVLYPADENAKGMNSMVGKPLTIGHPIDDKGNYLSGREGVGMQNHYSGGHVTKTYNVSGVWYADAEIKTALLNAQENGPELISVLDNKLDLGVSTGLLFSQNQVSGENEKGDSYEMSAINQEYDHLAALLNEAPAGGSDTIARFNSQDIQQININQVIDELSHDDIRYKLSGLIKPQAAGKDSYCWVVDVFRDYFIYTIDDSDFYRQGYSVLDGDVSLVGEKSKVEKRWQIVVNALKKLNPFMPKVDEHITKRYNEQDKNINVNENEVPEMELEQVKAEIVANNDAISALITNAVSTAVEPLKAELESVKASVNANADKEKADLVAKVNKLELGLPESAVNAMNTDELNSVLAKHEGAPADGVKTNSRHKKPESDGLDAEMPE